MCHGVIGIIFPMLLYLFFISEECMIGFNCEFVLKCLSHMSPALCCSEGAGRVVAPVHLSDVCCHLLAVEPKDTVSG